MNIDCKNRYNEGICVSAERNRFVPFFALSVKKSTFYSTLTLHEMNPTLLDLLEIKIVTK